MNLQLLFQDMFEGAQIQIQQLETTVAYQHDMDTYLAHSQQGIGTLQIQLVIATFGSTLCSLISF